MADINGCPPATQDIALNLTNRKKAIDTAMYGPLNPAEPNEEYWNALGQEWNVDAETAKKQRCGNCAVFIQTPEMLSCIETGLTDNADEFDSINEAGELGYCEIFDFKCASARTCRAWVAGGPVTAAAIDLISDVEPITAAQGPCWDGYKQVGMKKGKDGKMVPNCVPKDASDSTEFASKDRTVSQTPAPKKDKVKGSSKNKKGSASGTRKVVFSKATENTLSTKVKEHNEKAPEGRKASLGMLKAVYRRGAGAFSTSHRPGMNRNQWAMGRVNAFLKLLKSGKPTNSAYTTDNDLLPAKHPRSTKRDNSITAAAGLVPEESDLANALVEIAEKYGKFNEDATGIWAGYTPAGKNEYKGIGVKCSSCVLYMGNGSCKIIEQEVEDEGKCRFAVIPDGVVDVGVLEGEKLGKENRLTEEILQEYRFDQELSISLGSKEDYNSPEDAILAMAEFSGAGYEAEDAIRASWLRAVRAGGDPFRRASLLALHGELSLDADLLPSSEEEEDDN
jgi:hypothetical protein